MRPFYHVAFALLAVVLTACPSKKEGYIEGTVIPPSPDIRVSASQEGRTIVDTAIGPQDGRFRIVLPPGSYDIALASPSSPFPLVLSGVIVRPGETTLLDPISLGPPPEGSAVVKGVIQAAGAGTTVALVSGGIERASVSTNAKGAYVFERMLPGDYTLQVRSPGYADDSRSLTLMDGRTDTVDIRMIYISSLEGVDWKTGLLRVRGVGLPPPQAPTPTIRREMAKRAALADAERNLLRMMELVQVGPEEKLTTLLGEKTYVQKLEGVISGHRIAADRDLNGGRVEIELELPLTGPGGLTSALPIR